MQREPLPAIFQVCVAGAVGHVITFAAENSTAGVGVLEDDSGGLALLVLRLSPFRDSISYQHGEYPRRMVQI